MSSNSLGKKKTKKRMKKVLFTSFLAVILAVSTMVPGMLLGTGSSDNVAHAESLLDVNLLRNVTVEADLGNVEGEGDYTLDLKLTGTGVADVELVKPDKTVVFYAKEIADKWEPTGTAHVEAKLLPISLKDIPAVTELLDGLILTLNDVVNGLVGTVNELNSKLIAPTLPILEIEGLEALENAIAALANLDDALIDLTLYEEDIEVVVGDHGELIVTFTDALGQRLETAVNDVVVKLLQDVIDAIQALGIKVDLSKVGDIPIVGDLPILGDLLGAVGKTLDDLLGETLDTLVGPEGILFTVVDQLLDTVEGVLAQVTQTVLGLADFLLTLQVLGDTTVTLSTTVDKPVGFSGEVKVFGEGVNTSAITLDLLSSFVNYDTIVFNEGTPPAEEPKPEPKPAPKPAPKPEKPEKPGIKLPDTATAAGAIGLTGLTALLAGIATRLFGRRK